MFKSIARVVFVVLISLGVIAASSPNVQAKSEVYCKRPMRILPALSFPQMPNQVQMGEPVISNRIVFPRTSPTIVIPKIRPRTTKPPVHLSIVSKLSSDGWYTSVKAALGF